jgi:hypothetical protein
MNSLYKVIICAACLAILATAPIASAQGKLVGVWKVTEVNLTVPSARTITPFEPGIFVFTKKHVSFVMVNGDKPRPALPEKDATDAQKLATWTPFNAGVGTYEIKGTTVTAHPIIGKNPNKPGLLLTFDFKIEGNTLSITPKTDQSGSAANPMTVKLVRVE